MRRRRQLAGMRARRVHARVERFAIAAEDLDHQRGGAFRRRHELLGADHHERRLRGLARGAVHQRERLASLERDRRQARGGQGDPGLDAPALAHDGALASHRPRDMRQLDQIATRADGAGLGNDRQDARVQHREQRLDDDRPHARASLRQRLRPHRHRRADDLVDVRRADAAGVAAQQVQLEARGVRGENGPVAQRTASRVQPVDDAPRLRERLDLAMRVEHAGARGGVEAHRRARRDPGDGVQRERLAAEQLRVAACGATLANAGGRFKQRERLRGLNP